MNRRDQLVSISCDECGADQHSRAVDCCDSCIIKIFANDPREGSLTDWVQSTSRNYNKYELGRVLDLVERLADELAEMHNMTAIELESWQTARMLVEMFYEVRTVTSVGRKKV